jgi:hypothetical protein
VNLKSIFSKPEGGIYAGLAQGVAIYLIYQSALPPHADIRTAQADNGDIEAARKGAAYKSAALLGVVFLLSRDLNAFIIGGTELFGIDYLAKHHNMINPLSGKFDTGSAGGQSTAPSNVYSLPDYGQTEAM